MVKNSILFFLITFFLTQLSAQDKLFDKGISFKYTGNIADTVSVIQPIQGELLSVDYLILQEGDCDILLTILTPEKSDLTNETLAEEYNFKIKNTNDRVSYGKNDYKITTGYDFKYQDKKGYIIAKPNKINIKSVLIFSYILDLNYKECSSRGAKWVKEILKSLNFSHNEVSIQKDSTRSLRNQ